LGGLGGPPPLGGAPGCVQPDQLPTGAAALARCRIEASLFGPPGQRHRALAAESAQLRQRSAAAAARQVEVWQEEEEMSVLADQAEEVRMELSSRQKASDEWRSRPLTWPIYVGKREKRQMCFGVCGRRLPQTRHQDSR
ncbi:ANKRD50, partial [Symbiodinium sp. KB8]